MSILSLLLVVALATARLGRLVNDDEIAAPLRSWAVHRWGEGGKIPYLLHCPWCAGLWISIALAIFAWLAGLCNLAEAALIAPAAAYLGAIARSMIEG